MKIPMKKKIHLKIAQGLCVSIKKKDQSTDLQANRLLVLVLLVESHPGEDVLYDRVDHFPK